MSNPPREPTTPILPGQPSDSGRLMHKEVGGIHFAGFSIAGEESVVAVPEYNVCFDVGRAPREMIPLDWLCISHGHMDHAAGVAYYLSQRGFMGNAPGNVVVHRSLAQAFQRLQAVWSEIEGHPCPGRIIGVEHLEDVPIRKGLLIRPFSVNHSSGAMGFSLIESRHKLKPEFHGKTGPELVALKCQGIAIDANFEFPLVTYSGDTAVGRFLDLDFVRTSRVLVLECTFYERDHRTRAQAGRHIHVDDLPKILEAVPDAQFLLVHHSRRTDLRLAKRILQRVVRPADAERITFLMDRPPKTVKPPHPLSEPPSEPRP